MLHEVETVGVVADNALDGVEGAILVAALAAGDVRLRMAIDSPVAGLAPFRVEVGVVREEVPRRGHVALAGFSKTQ